MTVLRHRLRLPRTAAGRRSSTCHFSASVRTVRTYAMTPHSPVLTGTHPRARQVMERRTGVITLAYLISLGKQCRRFSSTQRVCTFLGERAKDMRKETTSLWSVLLDQGHVAMYSIYCTMTPLCRKARVNEAQRTS